MNNQNNNFLSYGKFIIILKLDNPSQENLQLLENYVMAYFVKQDKSEIEIIDPVINEAKLMYNELAEKNELDKITPGVRFVIDEIRRRDQEMYNLGSKTNYGFSLNILIISGAILLGGLLALLLVYIK